MIENKKGPGRPPKNPRRRRREIGGRRLKLSAQKIPGSEVRWVNDYRNRIHDFTVNDDWDFVMKEDIKDESGRVDVGDPDKSNVVQPGEKVCVPVGTDEGKPLYAYLLKKKKQHFDEDYAESQKQVDEVEKQLFRSSEGIGQQNWKGGTKDLKIDRQ